MAICWFAAVGARSESQDREVEMHATFYQSSPGDMKLPAQASIAIHDAAAPAGERYRPAQGGACERPYCGPERNSRIAFRFGGRSMHVSRKAELPSGFQPRFVMSSHDRVLVDGHDAWLLLDPAGHTLQWEQRGEGDICADSSSGLFYTPNPNGYLAAYHLRDGKKAFLLSLYFGSDFGRSFILPNGSRLLVTSIERRIQAHASREPNMAVVEVHEIRTPLVLSDVGRIQSEQRVHELKRRTGTLLTAAHGDTLILATSNAAYVADRELTLRRELTGDFEPLQMSLDEQPRIYLVVRSRGEVALWVLTMSGERTARVPLPAGFVPAAPPIVAFDHTVYLISGGGVLAVDSSGRTLWERKLGSVGGAVVDLDNSLLVSVGDAVIILSPKGEQQTMFQTAGDVLTTPPSVTQTGDLLAGGQKSIYFAR